MTEEIDHKREELAKLQDELNRGALSRRQFLDRLAALGLTFGAAAALAGSADAKTHPETGVSLGSTNPSVNAIALEGREEALGDGEFEVAQRWRRRRYRRFYRRFYRRYRRFYRRFYRRYGRAYRRFYRRF